MKVLSRIHSHSHDIIAGRPRKYIESVIAGDPRTSRGVDRPASHASHDSHASRGQV
jgi:hypothetical protein